MKTYIYSILTLMLGISILSSCKKDKDENDEPVESGTFLKMDLYHSWSDADFAYDAVYDVNGTLVKFTEIRYYLSNFVGMSDDMTTMTDFGQYLLIDAGVGGVQDLGRSELAHLHMLNFHVGLDEETNHQDPTIADEPLNDPLMHWGWNPAGGYKFIKIEGERDRLGNGNYEPFSIHVATDPMLRSISKMVHEDISGSNKTISGTVDIMKWFEHVDLSPEVLEGTHGEGTTTNDLMDGVVDSFSFM